MTQDPAGLEDYVLAPAGQCMKSATGISLSMTGYRRLRLLVDQGTRNFRGPMHKLVLERVAHVPNLGEHNLLSTERLAQGFLH